MGLGKASIWNEVKGQTLLGEEGFVDGLSAHLSKHKGVPEALYGALYMVIEVYNVSSARLEYVSYRNLLPSTQPASPSSPAT